MMDGLPYRTSTHGNTITCKEYEGKEFGRSTGYQYFSSNIQSWDSDMCAFTSLVIQAQY